MVMYLARYFRMLYVLYGHQMRRRSSNLERDEFKDFDLHKGFFCYKCIYWIDMTGGKCMIVDDKRPDVFGNVSDVIAPHGCCNGYEPDFDEINEQKEVKDNKTSFLFQ